MAEDAFTKLVLDMARERRLRRSIDPPVLRPIHVHFEAGVVAPIIGEAAGGATLLEGPEAKPLPDPYTWDYDDIKFKIRAEFAFRAPMRPVLLAGYGDFEAAFGPPLRWSDLYLFPARSHAESAEAWIEDFHEYPSWTALWGAVKHAFLSGVEDA